MLLNFHYSLKTNCYDSEGKFVTNVPMKTTECDVDTCSQIGELNSAFQCYRFIQIKDDLSKDYILEDQLKSDPRPMTSLPSMIFLINFLTVVDFSDYKDRSSSKSPHFKILFPTPKILTTVFSCNVPFLFQIQKMAGACIHVGEKCSFQIIMEDFVQDLC